MQIHSQSFTEWAGVVWGPKRQDGVDFEEGQVAPPTSYGFEGAVRPLAAPPQNHASHSFIVLTIMDKAQTSRV